MRRRSILTHLTKWQSESRFSPQRMISGGSHEGRLRQLQYDDGETAICFMGHGTEAESNQVYAKMQDMLTEAGYKNYYVGTVEAAPSLDDVLAAVEEGFTRRWFGAADDRGRRPCQHHGRRRRRFWKTAFEDAGYEVTCLVNGLGQLEAIQQLFVEHAQAAVDSLTK